MIASRPLVLALGLVCFGAAVLSPAAAESVIAPGEKLKKLADGFKFTEGPTCDANGNIFFTDQPNDRILKWSVRGKLSTFLQPAGRANGLCFDAHGNLIACAEANNELWAIAPDKTVTVLVTNFDGKFLNGPNDVWAAPDGSLYFTDPFYRRGWADTNAVRVAGENVYHLSPSRENLRAFAVDLKKPNGITGSPDGKNLFVADIRANQTWRYDILPDGSLTNKTPFCPKGSDGMTIDADGNLYLCATGATNGVTVFDKAGKQIDHIDVPERWTANVSFGGKDHRTLFITASESLYSIKLRVKGANVAK
ncbi:MAG: SMP-30/gluconolactonase/LRE family protein [Verrucomicrobiales bacterium]|nr:SMP-30/gluconolactonase/LRE family protein [Verrucomicrobiales bacterium]